MRNSSVWLLLLEYKGPRVFDLILPGLFPGSLWRMRVQVSAGGLAEFKDLSGAGRKFKEVRSDSDGLEARMSAQGRRRDDEPSCFHLPPLGAESGGVCPVSGALKASRPKVSGRSAWAGVCVRRS